MATLFGIELKRDIRALSTVKQRLAGVEGSSYYLFIGLLVLVVVIFMALTNSFASKRERMVEKRQAEFGEFYGFIDQYKKETASIEYLRAKLLIPEAGVSTGTLLEAVGSELGMEKNITSFKPLEEGLVNGYMEKGVQVDIEGVSLNQIVNFLYKIRAHRNLLLIRDFSMKAHFANPSLLDVTVQVVLVTRHSGGG